MSKIRQNVHLLMLAVAGCLFVGSLLLPGFVLDLGSWGRSDRLPGWLCTLVYFPAWPSNLLMLFSPLLSWIAGQSKARTAGWLSGMCCGVFALTCGVSLTAAVAFDHSNTLQVGFYVWTASLAVAALSFLIGPTDREDRTRSPSVDTRDQVPEKEKV